LTFVKRSFHANFLLQTHSVITIQQNTAANCRQKWQSHCKEVHWLPCVPTLQQ